MQKPCRDAIENLDLALPEDFGQAANAASQPQK
jgi:hypothetical protein